MLFLEVIPDSIDNNWPDWMQGYSGAIIFLIGPFLIGAMPVLLWKIYDRMISGIFNVRKMALILNQRRRHSE